MIRQLPSPEVVIGITVARRRLSREVISVSNAIYQLNPGEARALADDLARAADLVDSLCPPAAITDGQAGSVTITNHACDCCHLGSAAHCQRGEHCVTSQADCNAAWNVSDHQPACHFCGVTVAPKGSDW